MNFVSRMNSVLDYIEENLGGEIKDDKIAVLSANSKGMFQRVFTMITDMTLSEYIRKRRLTQASIDIQNTDEKVIDIAIKYGYNSADAFTAAFKSYHGVTPSGAKNLSTTVQSFQRFTFNHNLTIKGGNNMQYRTITLEETIYFYLRSDFLLLNTLLGGKMNNLWKAAEKVNKESKGMLQEFEDGIRTLDERQIARYHNRIFETLDNEAKENIIKIAKIDIANFLNAMKPAQKETLIYRSAWCHQWCGLDKFDENPSYSLPKFEIEDIVEFNTLLSTALAPYDEGGTTNFYRYEITVPVGKDILQLDDHEEYATRWFENGEVILPPMKCRVKNIRKSDNEYCKGIIEMEYLERLADPV